MKGLALALCVALLAGCATPEGFKKLKRADEVVYEVPAEGVDGGALFSGIDFKPRRYECVRDGYRFQRDTKVVAQGNDRCEVSFVTTILPGNTGGEAPSTAFKSYIFKVDRSKDKSITRLEFKPLYEVLEPPAVISRGKISPPHTLEDALEVIATSGTVTFQFEIDSRRKPGVILKNVRKYFKEQVHLQHPVEVMKKSFNTSYLLYSGDNPIATFYLALSPLRKGTRATVIARVHLAADENYHIDASDQAKDIKKLITEAVTE